MLFNSTDDNVFQNDPKVDTSFLQRFQQNQDHNNHHGEGFIAGWL